MSRALFALQRDYESPITEGEFVGGPVLAWYQGRWWEAAAETSAAASLAYLALRPLLRGPGATVEAVVLGDTYPDGARGTGVLITRGDTELLVTSLPWGYRGQGASTLAAILADVGALPGFDVAKAWVERLPKWRLDWAVSVPGGASGG